MVEATELLQSFLQHFDIYNLFPRVYFKYLEVLPIVVTAFILSFLLTPIIGQIALKFKITDDPASLRKTKLNKYDNAERHIHTKSTPYLGGLAVLIPLVIGLLIFFRAGDITTPLLIALVILIIAGIIDDVFNLPSQVQLTLQIVASLIVAGSLADLTFVNNPFGGTINLNFLEITTTFLNLDWRFILLGDLLIIPWIILCINAVKWVGGSDGLMEGNMLIAYILLMLLGIRDHNLLITSISAIMTGGILAFLIFNFPPAKIFSGSTGKTVFGFLIATLAFIQGAKFATAILILALPLIDSLFVIVKRYIEFRPKNPLDLMRINGKHHLHHQLLDMNFTPKQVLLIELSITLLTGSIAVVAVGAFKFFALLIIGVVLIIGILLIHRKAQKEKLKKLEEAKKQTPESKYSY